MKKSTLSELINHAESDPDSIDLCAYYLTHELSGVPVEIWLELLEDNGTDATKEEIQQACVSLVRALEMHGQPPSKRVVKMLEWAIGQHQRKPGNPGELLKRELAIFEEGTSQCLLLMLGREGQPISQRELAKRVGVSRTTIREWRKEPDYLAEVAAFIKGDFEQRED